MVVGKHRQTCHLVNNGFGRTWLHSRCEAGVCAGSGAVRGSLKCPLWPRRVGFSAGDSSNPGQAGAQADGVDSFALWSPLGTVDSWAMSEQS